MNKEVEEALGELKYKRFYSNGVGVDLIDSYPKLFNSIEQALNKLKKYEELKIKVMKYMQLNSSALLFKDKWDEKIELEKEILKIFKG